MATTREHPIPHDETEAETLLDDLAGTVISGMSGVVPFINLRFPSVVYNTENIIRIDINPSIEKAVQRHTGFHLPSTTADEGE